MRIVFAIIILLGGIATAIPAWPSWFRQDDAAFTWGSTKIRGINIGGWLVLECWLTPSIFEGLDQSLGIVDEYTLGKHLPDQAPTILKQHWESWLSFDDLQKIASAGFNAIRIPIGYWAYDNSDSPYITGADDYLRTAVEWAGATIPPLRVIIDLHGTPGSQNGYDNSGQRTSNPIWLTDGGASGASAVKTLSVLATMAEIYAGPMFGDTVIGIELVNEPQGWRLDRTDLANFYVGGYNAMRAVNNATVVVLQDAFDPPSSWNGLLTPQSDNAENVALAQDHHYYQIFSVDEVAMLPAQHITTVCNDAPSYSGADKWTFIGEWTAAMTDCAKYLNGYGVGSRFDGTYPNASAPTNYALGSCAGRSEVSSWSNQMRADTRRFIEAQMDAFEANSQGWFWWNFKTEAAGEWDAFKLLEAGIFPQPLTAREFPQACVTSP